MAIKLSTMKNYKLEDDRFKHESFYQLSSVFFHSLSAFLLEESIELSIKNSKTMIISFHQRCIQFVKLSFVSMSVLILRLF